MPSAPKKFRELCSRNFFIQSEGLVCHQRARSLYGIATKSRMASREARIQSRLLRIDAIHHFVMIPYGTSCQFHTATSCGFHTRLRRDLGAKTVEMFIKSWYNEAKKGGDDNSEAKQKKSQKKVRLFIFVHFFFCNSICGNCFSQCFCRFLRLCF